MRVLNKAGRALFTALLILGATGPARPQETVEANEKKIAALPPSEQAYERYRFWVTQQPPGKSDGDRMSEYRAYLKSRGFSEAEAGEQIRSVQKEGERAEVQRWNRILTSETARFNTNPNEFLVEMAKGRKVGTALDVGMGQGRNSLWLAQQGWEVTGFDPADAAVTAAQKSARALGVEIHTEIQGSQQFEFGERRWDLILISYAGGRGLTERVERALRPGGLLVIEAFHRDATRGRSIGGDVVFDTGELPRLFPGLRVVRYEEPVRTADFGKAMVRLVRYAAVKPE